MRLISINVLRGIAVLLVISRHLLSSPDVLTIGWIGVDLFFVLSGFLVSNLLFQEFNLTGTIKPWRFLIRRGLKIYPLFYIMIVLVFFIKVSQNPQFMDTYKRSLWNEVLFIQNYNYQQVLIGHTWSLAVEEHFYLGLVFLFLIFIKLKVLNKNIFFNVFTAFVLLLCMNMRNNVGPSDNYSFAFANYLLPTHLRFDTLWIGTFIAFHYNYNQKIFLKIFSHTKTLWLGIGAFIIPICFPLGHTFLVALGLPIIAICFGIALATLIVYDKNGHSSSNIFNKKLIYWVAKIGENSYAIYLFHMIIIGTLKDIEHNVLPQPFHLIFTLILIVTVGVIATELIEKPILRWRDKYIK